MVELVVVERVVERVAAGKWAEEVVQVDVEWAVDVIVPRRGSEMGGKIEETLLPEQ